jgi:hypothetical protein
MAEQNGHARMEEFHLDEQKYPSLSEEVNKTFDLFARINLMPFDSKARPHTKPEPIVQDEFERQITELRKKWEKALPAEPIVDMAPFLERGVEPKRFFSCLRGELAFSTYRSKYQYQVHVLVPASGYAFYASLLDDLMEEHVQLDKVLYDMNQDDYVLMFGTERPKYWVSYFKVYTDGQLRLTFGKQDRINPVRFYNVWVSLNDFLYQRVTKFSEKKSRYIIQNPMFMMIDDRLQASIASLKVGFRWLNLREKEGSSDSTEYYYSTEEYPAVINSLLAIPDVREYFS